MIEHRFECTKKDFLNFFRCFQNQEQCALLLSEADNQPSYFFLFPQKSSQVQTQEPWQDVKHFIQVDPQKSAVPRYVGYFSYEMGAYSDAGYRPKTASLPVPLFSFFKAGVTARWQHQMLTITVFDDALSPLHLLRSYWQERLQSHSKTTQAPLKQTLVSQTDDLESYLKKIEIAKNYIYEGDVYQVNLSRSTTYQTHNTGADIFLKLVEKSSTPFSAYLKAPGYEIISISPERFLKYDHQILQTFPIKGTARRGRDPQEDQAQLKNLLTSEKEDAELMMICDLMRNDLGKICKVGSVTCPSLKKVLKLSNVYHLYSAIQGEPLSLHPVDMIRSCFPAGSITGCPKIRAMEIIQEIEKRPRHIYCGAIGYFTESGAFDFNVAIRTALLKDELLEVQSGGAITDSSNPLSEFEETFYKANPFIQILQTPLQQSPYPHCDAQKMR